ncbi:MAG TPA: SDR family NAD(P)-dependent oxidoreductase [Sphingomonadaceae bacterium]
MSAFNQMEGRVAVVTGGASGIGFGIAKKLGEQGMKLALADIDRGPLEKAAAELGALPVHTDVSDADSVARLAQTVIDELGAVHVVCNNAGIGSSATIAQMNLSDWRWMIDVNLYGVINGVNTFLPLLQKNPEGGHFVNTASIAGLVSMPGMAAYAATKFGVVALTETLALELAAEDSKVGATVLCPGTVRTNIKNATRNRPAAFADGAMADLDLEQSEFGAMLRWASPEEVGDIVVRAIRRGDLYAFTHPEMCADILNRHDAIAQAVAASHAELAV